MHNQIDPYFSHSTTTRQLVDKYELQCQKFRATTTLNEFRQLFPSSATSIKIQLAKETVKLKFKSCKEDNTIEDLTIFVALFGVSASHLHLSKVEYDCSAVIWRCSFAELKLLKMAISETATSFESMGVLQIFVGKNLVLDCSQSHTGIYIIIGTATLLIWQLFCIIIKVN